MHTIRPMRTSIAPQPDTRRSAAKPATLALLSAIAALSVQSASGATYFWDANGATAGVGGTGTWDTSSSLWRTPASTSALTPFVSTSGAGAHLARFSGTAGTVTIASGTTIYANGLTFDSTGFTLAGGAGSVLSLEGSTAITLGPRAATISANIAGVSGLTKATDGGTLTLAGINTYSGNTTINSGRIILDMNAGGSLNSAGTLVMGATIGSGTFEVRGKDGVASSQTLAGLTGGVQHTLGQLVLRPGSGAGSSVDLTINSAWTRPAAGFTMNVDLSAGNATVTSPSFALTSGIGSNGWITVTDAGGTGFATLDGSNHVVRYTGATALPTGGTASGTNYVTKVGDAGYVGNKLTLTAGRTVNTLQLDSSGGSGVLDLGTFTLGVVSRAVLMTGANDFTIQNGQLGAGSSEVIIHHYGTGALTVSGPVSSGTARLTKDGPGLLVLTGTNTYTSNTGVQGGVLRARDGIGLPVTSQLTLSNGVFETDVDFTRAVGSSGQRVILTGGSAGFSAYGAPINVNLGGAGAVQQYVVGGQFMPEVLVLNASTANNTLNFVNALDFNGADRTVAVHATGGDATAATISGVISNTSGSVTAGLVKQGVGKLVLTAANTYNGGTTIGAGTLQLGNGGTTGSLSTTGAIVNNGSFVVARSNAVAQGVDFSAAAITGTGSFVQAGSGVTTLTAANTYSGNTTIAAGTLALAAGGSFDNSPVINLGTAASQGTLDLTAKSAFTFGAGQTVAGHGAINLGAGKTVTVNGNLAPGNSAGAIAVTGDLALGGSSATTLQIVGRNGGAPVSGVDFDQVVVSGSASFGGALTIDTTGLGGLIAGDSFQLFSAGSYAGQFGSVSITGAYAVGGLAYNPGSDTWTGTDLVNNLGFSFSESSGYLSVTAVPEPSSAALLAGGLMLGLGALRRRRR